jgi:hypothetical protein
MGWQEAVEKQHRVDRRAVGDRLGQVGQTDQHQQDERHRGKQRVKRERAGKKRNVVFVSRLERAGQETGG